MSRQAAHALDLREGERWTLAQRAKNDVIYALVRVALAIASLASAPTLRRVGRGLGWLAHLVLPGERRRARANVRRVLPGSSEAERLSIVRDTFLELGEHLGDAVASLRAGSEIALIELPATERAKLDEAVRSGRGVLFVSAHLGPWERVAATIVAAGYPFTTIARESYDPRLTSLYEKLRGGRGVRAIYRGEARAPVAMVRTLRKGELLGVPMDLRSRVTSIDVPFLGLAASTPVGPARIALRTGACVVVATIAPTPSGTLALTVTPIATHDLLPGAAGELALTTRLNDELSLRILALPRAWPWMHPRW
ncbi:MAG: Lipid biosynthesis lauroyl acyltransferase [Myxococcaceae bacterium]|nr:Lipid biosynthesis lauroyl acyltransferase [Myxococcaceae bacterium]